MCFSAPSNAQNQLSAEQGNFYKELQSSYSTAFGKSQQVLDQLHTAWSPVLSGGINQEGFSPEEKATLNSKALTDTANNYKHTSQAVNESMAAQGGGNTFLPRGSTAAVNAGIAEQAEQNLDQMKNQNRIADYAQGRQNFQAAAGALSGVAAQQGSAASSAGGQANSAGNAAFDSATTLYKENQANNSWKGSLVNAGIGALTGGITGGMGNLDTMGTSTGGEQFHNFLSGALSG